MYRKVHSTAVKALNRAVEMDSLQISQSTLQLMKVHTHIDLISKNEKEREKTSSVIVHLFGRIVKFTFGIWIDPLGNSNKMYPTMNPINHGENRKCVGT